MRKPKPKDRNFSLVRFRNGVPAFDNHGCKWVYDNMSGTKATPVVARKERDGTLRGFNMEGTTILPGGMPFALRMRKSTAASGGKSNPKPIETNAGTPRQKGDPFDVERFKNGEHALDRMGRMWVYLGENKTASGGEYPLVAASVDVESRGLFNNNGRYYTGMSSPEDLVFMVPRREDSKRFKVDFSKPIVTPSDPALDGIPMPDIRADFQRKSDEARYLSSIPAPITKAIDNIVEAIRIVSTEMHNTKDATERNKQGYLLLLLCRAYIGM